MESLKYIIDPQKLLGNIIKNKISQPRKPLHKGGRTRSFIIE